VHTGGPSPGGQPFAQNQGGYGGPGMNQQYQQMPGSAGGFGRGAQPQGQWPAGQHGSPGGYGQPNNGYGY
jgi:nucleolysin TIA-1/TIAR